MTYSYGPPHMAKQKQDDQPELTYSSYVRTRDVTQKTCRRRWMIGRSGERWSGISVLAARHDDDFFGIVIWYQVFLSNINDLPTDVFWGDGGGVVFFFLPLYRGLSPADRAKNITVKSNHIIIDSWWRQWRYWV